MTADTGPTRAKPRRERSPNESTEPATPERKPPQPHRETPSKPDAASPTGADSAADGPLYELERHECIGRQTLAAVETERLGDLVWTVLRTTVAALRKEWLQNKQNFDDVVNTYATLNHTHAELVNSHAMLLATNEHLETMCAQLQLAAENVTTAAEVEQRRLQSTIDELRSAARAAASIAGANVAEADARAAAADAIARAETTKQRAVSERAAHNVDNAILVASASLVELEQTKRDSSQRDFSREMETLRRCHMLLRATIEDRTATNATEAAAFAAMQVNEMECRCAATRQHTTTRERDARRALMLSLAETPVTTRSRTTNDRPTRATRSATRGTRAEVQGTPTDTGARASRGRSRSTKRTAETERARSVSKVRRNESAAGPSAAAADDAESEDDVATRTRNRHAEREARRARADDEEAAGDATARTRSRQPQRTTRATREATPAAPRAPTPAATPAMTTRRRAPTPPAAAPPGVVPVAHTPAAEPARVLTVKFDGGHRPDPQATAAAAFISPTTYEKARLQGNSTSYRAEVCAAGLAHALAARAIAAQPADFDEVHLVGDNQGVVTTAALGEDVMRVKTVPGRSPNPKEWGHTLEAVQKLDAAIRDTNRAITVKYRWVPRRFNVEPDEICNAAMDNREPDFSNLRVLPLPPNVDVPTAARISDIAKWALETTPDTIRSIPQTLKPLWHQALSHVASWTDPNVRNAAMLLAPRVLLQRTHDLRAQLVRYATSSHAVEEAFWVAANRQETPPGDDAPVAPAQAQPLDTNWKIVERTAAQAPKKAIAMLHGRAPTIDPASAEGRAAIERKMPLPAHGAPATSLPTELDDVGRPKWVSIETLVHVCAKRLARLSAPGPDGWTRELFLSSVCKGTATAIAVLMNAILSGEMQMAHDPTRAARAAMWRKSENGVRLVGLTSCISKIAWRAALIQHLRRAPEAHNHSMKANGLFRVIRALESARELYFADVKDAYFTVDRQAVLTELIRLKSPMAWLFARIYGHSNGPTAPALVAPGLRHVLADGLLPGCGGAAIGFAMALDLRLKDTAACPDVYTFADDASAANAGAMKKIIDKLGADNLAKFKAIHPTKTTIKVAGVEFPCTKATRVLGAFIGEQTTATELFREHIGTKLQELDKIVSEKELSIQARWHMLSSAILGITWAFAASKPAITLPCAPEVDKRVAAAVTRLLPPDAVPSRKSGELNTLPTASGGLGLPCYEHQAEAMYRMATLSLSARDENDPLPTVTPYQIRKGIEEAALARAKTTIQPIYMQAMSDTSRPWFATQHINRHGTISNEAFSLALAHATDHRVAYPTCDRRTDDGESDYDHSQRCPVCAGPSRHPRHEVIVTEILQTCRNFGIIASTNFFSLGIGKKRPDIIVYRGKSQKVPLLIDVTVTHQPFENNRDRPNQRTKVKQHKYKEFRHVDETSTTDFWPFVMTARGTITINTLKLISSLSAEAVRGGFATELISRVKASLINFEVTRLNSLKARHARGMLRSDPLLTAANSDDSDSDQQPLGG